MRVKLRRTGATPPSSDHEVAAPGPPRGAPVAAFAGILDGQSLWVAVAAVPGSLALRDTDSGDVRALTNDAPDDQPTYTSARMDLRGLPGDTPATYDVVLVPSGGRSPRPVWSGPLPAGRVAPARDERTQWGLQRTDDGWLQVSRTPLGTTGWLTGIEESPDGIRLTIQAEVSLEAPVVAALLADGEAVATFSMTQQGTTLTTVLSADATLDPDLDAQTRVVVGGPDDWTPVRRRHDDLPDPGRGAPLPPVTLPGTETPRIRLRFGGEGFLVARILPVSDVEGVTP